MQQLAESTPLRADQVSPISGRIALASDVCLYSEGLTRILAEEGRLSVCRIAATPEDTVAVATAGEVDALVLDGSMPNACDAVLHVRQRASALPIIIFGVPGGDDDLLALIEAGATAFVARDAPSTELIETIVASLASDSPRSPRGSAQVLRRLVKYARAMMQPSPACGLTARESEIAALLDMGQSNKEIASRLAISVATVKNHVHRILEKLHVQRRGQAGHRLRHQTDQRI